MSNLTFVSLDNVYRNLTSPTFAVLTHGDEIVFDTRPVYYKPSNSDSVKFVQFEGTATCFYSTDRTEQPNTVSRDYTRVLQDLHSLPIGSVIMYPEFEENIAYCCDTAYVRVSEDEFAMLYDFMFNGKNVNTIEGDDRSWVITAPDGSSVTVTPSTLFTELQKLCINSVEELTVVEVEMAE